MWWLLWAAGGGVGAALLLIAYLADRRGPTGITHRDRGQVDRIMRGSEPGPQPTGYLDAGGSP